MQSLWNGNPAVINLAGNSEDVSKEFTLNRNKMMFHTVPAPLASVY